LQENDIEASFAGLRWLAAEKGHSISSTSRSHIIGRIQSGRGAIYTLYGGKLSTYRALAEEIGSSIASNFGDDSPSRTSDPGSWYHAPRGDEESLGVIARFS
jgi:glycerol-3-phosphate dehydrogenase